MSHIFLTIDLQVPESCHPNYFRHCCEWFTKCCLNFWHLGLLLNHWPTDPQTLATLGAAHWISPATILNLSVCRGFTPTSLLNLSLWDQTCESFPTYLLLSAHFWVSHTLWISHSSSTLTGRPTLEAASTHLTHSFSISPSSILQHPHLQCLAYIGTKWLI